MTPVNIWTRRTPSPDHPSLKLRCFPQVLVSVSQAKDILKPGLWLLLVKAKLPLDGPSPNMQGSVDPESTFTHAGDGSCILFLALGLPLVSDLLLLLNTLAVVLDLLPMRNFIVQLFVEIIVVIIMLFLLNNRRNESALSHTSRFPVAMGL